MKCKTLLASLLLAGMTTQTAFAQANRGGKAEYPYVFIGVQGGGQLTWTNYSKKNLITPIGAVSVGGMFTPVVGTRLHVSGINAKGGIKSLGKTYDYKFVTSDIDLMLNLSNAFRPGKRNWVNAYLIGGVGLSYIWDNDDLKAIRDTHSAIDDLNLAWDKDRLVHNFRVGMQLEANINRFIGVNVEFTANNLHDRFNSKVNGHGDWQLQALAGVNFKLGLGKKVTHAPKPEPVAPPVTPPAPPAPKPEPKTLPTPPKPEPKPVVVKTLEKTSSDIFFKIGSSEVDVQEMQKVEAFANWMKAHPTAKAQLLGYADKGTGSEEINKKISEKRAIQVAKILTEKYGIDATRLTTGYKGDDVQPFRNNDSNRVVMCIAAEQ